MYELPRVLILVELQLEPHTSAPLQSATPLRLHVQNHVVHHVQQHGVLETSVKVKNRGKATLTVGESRCTGRAPVYR